MRWSICTISHPERHTDLARISGILADQIEQHPHGDQIEHVVHVAVGPFGELRNVALAQATGLYVNFVDDDDIVSYHYIDTILPLLDGVDCVGHRLQCYIDGRKQKPTYHDARLVGWYENDAGYYRDFDPKSPIRADIARAAGFNGGTGEDADWANRVRDILYGERRQPSQHYVAQALYFYFHSTTNSFQVRR